MKRGTFGPILVGLAVYHWLLLPRMRSWGATVEETRGTLPGDELSHHPVLSTHAVTIAAPPESVWPWLVQLGEARGGFYSHDWVERLMYGGRYLEGHSATRIHLELQDLQIGDKIKLAEPDFTAVSVTALEPPHRLSLGEDWHFILKDVPMGTRLIVRLRGDGWLKALFRGQILRALAGAVDYLVGEPLHFLMERAMLKGIASRVEAIAAAEVSSLASMPVQQSAR